VLFEIELSKVAGMIAWHGKRVDRQGDRCRMIAAPVVYCSTRWTRSLLTLPTATSTASDTALSTAPAEQFAPVEETPPDEELWAVVLAGGIGSRFWPLSSSARPKQVLALVSERPLIAETVARLEPVVPNERILVVTSADIATQIRAAIPMVPERNILVEPRPLGTAASLAWAAGEVRHRAGPDAIFCSIHADLAVAFVDAFRNTLREASRVAASADALVAVGVESTRAETGFGYLVPGLPLRSDQPLTEGGACHVVAFEEKPARPRAEALIREGALWNSGIFVWRTRVILNALAQHCVEIESALPSAESRDQEGFIRGAKSISIERGLLERCSGNLVVVPGEFGWDDVGTWAALRRARELDDTGNGAFGRTHFLDASGNVVHAEGSAAVLYGVDGLLVVTLPGLTFVTTVERAAELKPLLDSLPSDLRHPGRARDA
jgi:mannose-1-phosphate guanylyltransferase